MPVSCCIIKCTHRFKKGSGIIVYEFPKDKQCRFLWKSALKRKAWDPSSYERRNKNLEEQLAGHKVARYFPSSVEQQEECENDYCEEDCSEGEQDEEVHKLFGKNQDDDNAFCADWYNDPGHGMELTLGMSDEAEDLPHNQLLPKPSSKVSDRLLTTDTSHTSGYSQNERNADEKSKATAVSAISEIFSRCGVLHVHKNCQVTGGSRAEDHMTHCAMDEVLLQQKNSQQLAMDCKPYSQTYIDNEKASCKHRGKKMRKIKFLDHNAPKKIPIGIFQILYGQTPTAVLREHLDKMADVLGFSSVIDFCQKVVQISATNRLKMLQQFYTNEHGSKIASLFHSLPTPQTNTDTFSAVSSLAENDQIHVQPKYHPLLYHLTQERNHDTEFNIQTKKVIPQKSRSKTRTRKFVRYQPSYKQELTVKTNPNVQVCNFQKQDVQDSPTISDQVAVANPNRILEVKKHLKTLKSHNGKLHSTNLKNSKPLKHSVIFSEVDNIFLSNEDQKVMSRKPPPRSKTKFKSPTRGITRTLVKLCVSEGNQSSLMERNSSDAALGNLFNSSTLRDSLDDTSKWRKNSQKRKQTLEEQCSFKEGKNEHDSVFITGKMKRISETTSEEEGTPSLF